MRSRLGLWAAFLAASAAAGLASCGLPGAATSDGFGGGGAASSSARGSGGATNSGGGSFVTSTGSAGGPLFESQCKHNQFLVGVDVEKKQALCADIAANELRAMNAACFAYLGWEDSCQTMCDTTPSNWAAGSGSGCVSDHATQPVDYCTETTLGSADVHLGAIKLGPNNVDDTDRFFAGLHCTAPPTPTLHVQPCHNGEAIVAFDQGALLCGPLATPAVDFVKKNCQLAFGWQDGCQPSCGTNPPTAWGLAGDGHCSVGGGTNATCKTTTLDGESVKLFSFNPDQGTFVDNTDDFYIGVTCDQPPPAESHAATACGPGELAIGTHTNGTLECIAVDEVTYANFTESCAAYLGWTDCTDSSCTAPDKWGYATGKTCVDGTTGRDDVCLDQLGGQPVHLFGLHFEDGAENDTMFVTLACQ